MGRDDGIKGMIKYVLGWLLYQKYKTKGFLFIFNDAIGETFLTCSYVPAFIRKYGIEKPIAISNYRFKTMMPLYPLFSQIYYMSGRRLSCLCIYLSGKDFNKYHALDSINWDTRPGSIVERLDGKGGSTPVPREIRRLKKISEYMTLNDYTAVYHPVRIAIGNDAMKWLGIEEGNTVFLVPEANTCKAFPRNFWIKTAQMLESQGYKVLFNCGPGYDTGGFPKIMEKISDTCEMVRVGGHCISIMCGLAELLVAYGCDVDVCFMRRDGDRNDWNYTDKDVPFAIHSMVIADDESVEEIDRVYKQIERKYQKVA